MTQNRKKIFFTSDMHLGDRGVFGYDRRPFKDQDDQLFQLIKRFKSIVPENSVIYFLGDMGSDKEMIKDFLKHFPTCQKVLILGNHDRGMNAMYDFGFDLVLYNFSLLIANELVTFSHCPKWDVFREDTSGMRGIVEGKEPLWFGNHRPQYKKFSVEDQGQFHIHGHTHGVSWKDCCDVELGRQKDVGLVGNGFAPVSLSQIESWIMRTKKGEKNE